MIFYNKYMRRFFTKAKEEPKMAPPSKSPIPSKPAPLEERKKKDDEYSADGDFEGRQVMEPQDFMDANWNASDTFPSEKALILHFVNQNPGAEDLEEFIQDWICGDKFEATKKKVAKGLEKAAGFFDIEPQLLQEIIDAKQKMVDRYQGGAGQFQQIESSQANLSVFDKSEDNMKKFVTLQKILEQQYPNIDQQKLENMIRTNDKKAKYLILKHFKQKGGTTALESFVLFARVNDLPKDFFMYEAITQYKCEQFDKAIHLMYLRQNLESISQETGIDILNLEQLQECSQLYETQRVESIQSLQRTNFNYNKEDFTSDFALDLYQIYEQDAIMRIKQFNHELNTKQGNQKNKLISLKEFRTVTLIKKEHLQEPLRNCKTYAQMIQVVKPLIIAYLQCSLPLEELVQYITKKFNPHKRVNLRLTSQDLLDVILLDSEDDVKTLLLERYSIIYPIPMLISQFLSKETYLFYHLAYFMQTCKTILNFGTLRASWTQCGKSSFLDEVFSTDFTCSYRGNYDARISNAQGFAFSTASRNRYNLGRMNIQMPRNIDSYEDETQWQIIDCSRFCDPNFLDFFCWKVNMILVHIMATDMLKNPINEQIQKLTNFQKRVIIVIRDIDELTIAQQEDLDQTINQFETASLKFIKMQSMILKEKNRLENFERTNGESYEFCFNTAVQVVKTHVIGYKVHLNQQFDARALMRIYSQVNKIELQSPQNILYKDLQLVQQLIDRINLELSDQLKQLEQKYHEKLENEKDKNLMERLASEKSDIIASTAAMSILDKNQDEELDDEIRQSMIQDRILFYFSKYQKYQKYQNEVNTIISDQDTDNNSLEKNQQQSQVIQNRSKKMRKIFDTLTPFEITGSSDIFVNQILKHERSLLLVWILTERLNYESSTNPLWKRFLMNQEIFDKNIQEGLTKYSPNLDMAEMYQILNKQSYSKHEYQDYQLSVFDFFREMVLAHFYSKNQMKKRAVKLDKHSSPEQRLSHSVFQQQQQLNDMYLYKLKDGFSRYVETGESFELIDGEYLRIHDAELTFLMQNYMAELKRKSKGKDVRLYVVSQIGRQSVGKSFLFNHMFKTKFLNRSGRCTQGINMALRDLRTDAIDDSVFNPTDKLLILDTEGLGSLDKAKRLNGKDINFDRCMVLFCLTVSNALIITLKTEIDKETADLLSVCCWALQNLKIHKMSPPQIFFVLNQQADCNINNYMKSLNQCIDIITSNQLYDKDKIKEYIKISLDNFEVLPTAFNQEKRNYENLYNYPVQRSVIKPHFTEKCQNLGIKIIESIQGDVKNQLLTFDSFMKMAGDSFRTITSFPELLRYKDVNEYLCNKKLRDKVYDLLNLNKIITSDYQKINHEIIQKIHQIDLKLMKNTEEFQQDILQPLDEKYQENFQTLKIQYDEFSNRSEYKNYPVIIELNKQILTNQCIKRYQYFKNIIVDLMDQKYRQKLQKLLEDKVNQQIRKKEDHFIKLEQSKWAKDFDLIWDEVQKSVFKNDISSNKNSLDYFLQLFKEHYNLFKLESMDSHRITKDQIYHRYIETYISVQPSQELLNTEFDCASLIKNIIKHLKDEISDVFMGKKVKTKDANDQQVCFFDPNVSKQPAGKLENIQGKNQEKPKYICIESITEKIDESESDLDQFDFDEYDIVKKNKRKDEEQQIRRNNLQPSKELPQSVHSLVSQLIGKREDQVIYDANKNTIAMHLAQSLRAIGNPRKSVWDIFLKELDVELRRCLEERTQLDQSQLNLEGSDLIYDQTGINRSQDSNNFRYVIDVIQKYIQEIDFELGFIWVNLNTRARMYLNTLAFFYCLENRIQKEVQKKINEQRIHEQNKRQYFSLFLKTMTNKQTEKLEGLTTNVMHNNDDFKSLYISQNLISQIEAESRNLTFNYIVAQIQSQAQSEISNRALVSQINRKVKHRISSDGAENATDHEDVGVQYIINYHGLIEKTFQIKWSSIEDNAYNEAKRRYKEEAEISFTQILNAFKFLLAEMRSLVRKFPQYESEIQKGNKQVEDFFNTNELFEIFFELTAPTMSSTGQSEEQKLEFSLSERGSQDDPDKVDLSSINMKSKRPLKRKASNADFCQTQQSFYFDMEQFDNESQISVEDFDIDFSVKSSFNDGLILETHQSMSEEFKNQQYLDQKLSLDIYKLPILYLKWFLDADHLGSIQIQEKTLDLADDLSETIQLIEYSHQKYKLIKGYTYPHLGQRKDTSNEDWPVLSEAIIKKIKEAGLFDTNKYVIYNLYRFVSKLVENLEQAQDSIKLRSEEFKAMIQSHKIDLQQKSKGCQERCPACNKYCEEAFNHMAEGGMQSPHSCSQYGHWFFSMGGRIWADKTRECILVSCHDKRLKEFQAIKSISGRSEKWEEFKNRNNDWMWDEGMCNDLEFGSNFMINLHNMCGEQAYKHYKSIDSKVNIKYRKYKDEDSYNMRGLSKGQQICFVIDGTYSMFNDMIRARVAIQNLVKKDFYKEVAIIIYRDHDYEQLIEQFPSDGTFCTDMKLVRLFLDNVKTNKKGNSPNEAVLDGLAAAGALKWGNSDEKDLKVIHIFDAQPHGNWPNYEDHHEQSDNEKKFCCCCSDLCTKKWPKDVFEVFVAKKLHYHSIFTHEANYVHSWFSNTRRYNPSFEAVMKQKLGKELCSNTSFLISEKKLVDIKINDIIIKDRH